MSTLRKGGRSSTSLKLAGERNASQLPKLNRFDISALPINHGPVPALAYTVSLDGATVVFAGDQSLFSDYFIESLSGSEPALLIAHHAISGKNGQPRGLHRDPTSIGDMAAQLKARKLVLSHNMQRALNDLDASLKAIRNTYDGPVDIAQDHSCYNILP